MAEVKPGVSLEGKPQMGSGGQFRTGLLPRHARPWKKHKGHTPAVIPT